MIDQQNSDGAPSERAKSEASAAERIAKVLARAGLCSRREAEEWVAAGRVAVNGKVLESPAFTVTPNDRIVVDGQPLPVKERTRLWLFHKPRGLVTTNQDPEGRPTVFSVLPEDMPRVVTVGRLDINTEGLLLLTNDGGLARVLELPSTGWLRRYRVRAFGVVEEAALKGLAEGVSLDGVDYGPIEAVIERVQGSNIWLTLGLREGKNREVKRVLASLGLTVNRLIRVSFGPFQLGDLDEGEIREIRGRVLRDQLGSRLVAESGADFDAPVVHQVHGDDDEGDKRRVRGVPSRDEARGGSGRGRPERTRMEFAGTGEKRSRDRDRDREGGRGERDERPPRKGPFRSEGFRGRPEGGDGRPGKPGKFRSEGFRGRPDGDRPRSAGFRDRPDGDRPRSGGFRDRPNAEGQGDRPRPQRSRRGEDFGDWLPSRAQRPERPRGEGRGEERGDRKGGFRSEGRIGRPSGDRPRSGGFRDRPDGEKPRSGGFRDRPAGGRPRAEGFRDRSDSDRPRSGGFRDRPDGEKPRSGGSRDRAPADAGAKPARAEGFGPRGPRGMSKFGRKPPAGGDDRGGPKGPGRPKPGGGAGRGGPGRGGKGRGGER